MDYNIYTLGDIDFVWSAFNGIALIFSKYTGVKEFMTTAAVLAGVNLFYKTWLWVLNPTKTELPVFSWFLGLILFMMATVRVDVTIESVKSGEVRNVDDIPIFIAATATVTTNLSQGLLKDYKSAFDPLSPVNLSASTLDDDLTLGPMIKFMKFMQWGGDSQGYCSLFPEPESGLGPMNLCATIQSVAYNCLNATQNSSAKIAGKETIFNTIFSSEVENSLAQITMAVNSGLKNASANVVGANGSVSKPCKDTWATVLRITGTPEAKNTMSKLAQVNGIISPDEASGGGSGTSFADVMASANGMHGNVMSSHDAVTALFVMNELKSGASKYRTPLGISSDMQLFEASLKRTNNMASQGQLWMQLSGAAIAFLEMFSYMVAPFALLMLLALGGNGVAAAAKYLQLIVFVNIWPLTAVMVNAYVKKVVTADLDTWSSMSADNNAVTWMGIPGLAETYSSYLSVASALYALIPVLTLFLMTQSIHPMMNATKGVTPDAPVNNGHLTPQVWDAPNSGKSAFGDVSRTNLMSTGQGSLDGGSVKSNLERLGSWNVGSGLSAAQGQSASQTSAAMSSAQNSYQSAYSRMNELGRSSSSNSQFSTSLQNAKSYADEVGSSVSKDIASKYGLNEQQVANTVSSAVLNAGLSGNAGSAGIGSAVSAQLGATGSVSGVDTKSSQMSSDLSKAISSKFSENAKATEQFSQNISNVRSDAFAQTSAFKEGFSQMNQASQSMAQNLSTSVATNANANSQAGIDTKQSINLDMLSDSLRNKGFSDDDVRSFARKNGLDENAFMSKFTGYNDTFKASNQLGSNLQRSDALVATVRDFSDDKIAIDTARGETAASNVKDLNETSGLLKNFIADFGANAQQLNPVINQLDKLGGGSTGTETIAGMESKVPQSIGTGNVMGAGAVEGLGNDMKGAVGTTLESGQQAANQQPMGSSRSGVTAQNVGGTGERAVRQNHRDGQNENFSESDRSVADKLPSSAPAISDRSLSKLGAKGEASARTESTFENAAEATVGIPVNSGGDANRNFLNNRYRNNEERFLSNNIPAFTDRILNNKDMSDKDKNIELAQQAVFTQGAANRATGDEKRQYENDAQKLLDTLHSRGVNLERGDLKAIDKGFDTYNRNGSSLLSVVSSSIGGVGSDGSSGTGRGTNALDYAVGQLIQKNATDGSFTNKLGNAWRDGNQAVSNGLTQIGAKGASEFLERGDLIQNSTGLATSASNVSEMPADLGGKVMKYMQNSDAVSSLSDRFSGVNSQPAIGNYQEGQHVSLMAIKQQLSDSPDYGPNAAGRFEEFAKSNLSNYNENYSSRMDKLSNWLEENKR
ncbi:conjugal transfer protein TraG [Enterobacter sp. JMULE2]|uniref:conjugal transfer protein TraG N-terminal domain-containing protein n=1 Tax=Enterobacter sp. JMULE2 TaxID=2518340 RepID=UPI001574FE46|nr:conjugal transfer protein TraG N-terminal domain-containing protein [Enterobacter sp. JMULE2]NTZ41034.1 conjugal transfer protein TraG [Enterobacter sp. JMULE2]